MIANTITTIYAEATPNPETMKFVANRLIMKPNVMLEYHGFEETNGAPLAQMLFATGKVKSLFFHNNFVTVTKKPDQNWSALTAELRDMIKGFLNTSGDAIIDYPAEANKDENPDLENAPVSNANNHQIVDSIIQILDEYIKPAVEQDGGAITFKSFNEGLVTVTLQGSCSGCPSSTITLKAGIENLLKKMVPGVKEVVAENQ
jgi:Fe-S cluster biogenesis protein NfuA